MRLIGAGSHVGIDYLIAILFAIGPSVAGFAGRQATFAYVLAAVLVILGLFTRAPLGMIKSVRFPLHGAVELALAILVLILPWLANFSAGVHSRNFFILIGLLMLAIWFMTDFRGIRDRRASP